MDFIEQRPTPKGVSANFHADVSPTNNPQDSISVHIKVIYTNIITHLSNEGLSFECFQNTNDHGDKVLVCDFNDYLSTAGLIITCSDDVDSVSLIELALDYIGAGNLKYVVSERYIEVL